MVEWPYPSSPMSLDPGSYDDRLGQLFLSFVATPLPLRKRVWLKPHGQTRHIREAWLQTGMQPFHLSRSMERIGKVIDEWRTGVLPGTMRRSCQVMRVFPTFADSAGGFWFMHWGSEPFRSAPWQWMILEYSWPGETAARGVLHYSWSCKLM